LLARAGAIEAAAAVMAALIERRPDGAAERRAAAPPTLFTRAGCPESTLVRACLRLAGVDFVEREVGSDGEAAAALAATGVFATPLVVAGDRAFLAYPRHKLAEALGFRCRCPDVVGARRAPA
jgi:glutaredoxin